MDMHTLNFGIEIETVGLSKEGAARAIHGVVGGTVRTEDYDGWACVGPDGRVWRCVPDGSLAGSVNAEIVSPILTYTDIPVLQGVVRALRAAGARTDPSASVHIHVGAESFQAKHLMNLVKMVHKQERLIEMALGIQAHRLNRYCQPVSEDFISRIERSRPRTLAQVNAAWYGGRRENTYVSRYDHTRYRGINLNSFFYRKTIEFRLFESTLHAGKVKAYVQFCLALAAKALKAKGASSKRRDFNPATSKFDFRVFLVGLGLVGEEFKTARTHLLANLQGNSAWRVPAQRARNRHRSSVTTA
jgi:hypothetical protein